MYKRQAISGTEVEASKDKYTTGVFTSSAGSAAKVHVKYLDENGEEKSVEISFSPSSTSGGASATNFVEEAKKNSELSKLFDIRVNNVGNDSVIFEAKNAGSNQGSIVGIEVDPGSNHLQIAEGTHDIIGADAHTEYTLSGNPKAGDSITTVSYTHLDVYKRQKILCAFLLR